ncbi:hypothetical protein HYV91_01200 [Candidatus Wolfebacteria bacterium]|nr:hypothetical protein [Candidatus Wolfebacteria bacterium]
MSVYTTYSSFSAKRADQYWDQFDNILKNVKEAESKIKNLEEKLEASRDKITTEDLYRPGSKDQLAQKEAEVEGLADGLDKLRAQHPFIGSNLRFYIKDGVPVEKEIAIDAFAKLDLSFGGPQASFNEHDVYYTLNFLKLIFPEAGINVDEASSGMSSEQWLWIFNHIALLPQRLEENKNSPKLKRELDFPADEEEEFNNWLDEALWFCLDFLKLIRPVIADLKNPDTKFIVDFDSGPIEDLELIDRAQRHIAIQRKNPAIEKILINYEG